MDTLKLCGWAKSAAAPSQTGNLGVISCCVISDVGIGWEKGQPTRHRAGPGRHSGAARQWVCTQPAGGVCRIGPGAICSHRSGR